MLSAYNSYVGPEREKCVKDEGIGIKIGTGVERIRTRTPFLTRIMKIVRTTRTKLSLI